MFDREDAAVLAGAVLALVLMVMFLAATAGWAVAVFKVTSGGGL